MKKSKKQKPLRQKSLKGKKNAIGDLQKPRLSLIPKNALWALGKALTHGEVKYGSHNWRNGINISYLLDASMRHITQFGDGEDFDVDDSNNHHLGNAMANLAMAIELYYSMPEADDRYKKNVKRKNKKVTRKSGNS